MAINILILSAGRRVELTKAFDQARKKLSIDGKIIAVDISKTAPALYFADAYYIVPCVSDDKYIDVLIDICRKEEISLIVPTIDPELLILSQNKTRIENETKAKVLVSNIEVIETCRDKFRTSKCFQEHCIDAPKTYTTEEINNRDFSFPLFIKPLNGSGSVNTYKIHNEKELNFFIDYVPNSIVQEFISGTEYTIDVFTDFDSNIISIVPRARLMVRSGEVIKGKIEKNRLIIESVKKLVNCLNPIGPVTIQCFLTNDEKIKFIEINPRFGGGAPMSFIAGANSPEKLYRLLLGEELQYSEDYRDKLLFSRFDDSVIVEE